LFVRRFSIAVLDPIRKVSKNKRSSLFLIAFASLRPAICLTVLDLQDEQPIRSIVLVFVSLIAAVIQVETSSVESPRNQFEPSTKRFSCPFSVSFRAS
jgi:hypothetical protein